MEKKPRLPYVSRRQVLKAALGAGGLHVLNGWVPLFDHTGVLRTICIGNLMCHIEKMNARLEKTTGLKIYLCFVGVLLGNV